MSQLRDSVPVANGGGSPDLPQQLDLIEWQPEVSLLLCNPRECGLVDALSTGPASDGCDRHTKLDC